MNLAEMQEIVGRMSLQDYPVEGTHTQLGIEADPKDGWIAIAGKTSGDGTCWSVSIPAPETQEDLIREVLAAVGLNALLTVEARLFLGDQRICWAADMKLAAPFMQLLNILAAAKGPS